MRSTRQTRGFTIVELLIVIAIITVLIAILLPALHKARMAANNVVCMSNMRQITLATLMYANECQGYFPPYFRQQGGYHLQDDNYTPSMPVEPNSTVSMWDNGATPPITYGLGRLYELGYLHGDAVYYCPSQPDPARSYDGVPKPLMSDTTNPYNTDYHFNPHWTRPVTTAGVSASNRGVYMFPKLSQFDKNRALVVEFLYDAAHVAHWSGTTPGWNLAFPDGHVETAYSDYALIALNGMSGSNTNNQWRRFDDLLDILEATVTNRDPQVNPLTGAAYPANSTWDAYRVHVSAEY